MHDILVDLSVMEVLPSHRRLLSAHLPKNACPHPFLLTGIIALGRVPAKYWFILVCLYTLYEGRSICNENSPVYHKVLYLHTL